MELKVSPRLEAAYNEKYDEDLSEWRELGGKYKAENIVRVCRGHHFGKVLECGAGEGSILHFLDAGRAFSELHAVEISDSGIARIEARRLASVKSVKKFDGYTLPFEDGAFDMAFCSHVIEHVEHPRALLRELARVSRYQVFEVPLDYTADVDRKVGEFVAFGHINIYTPSTFKFLLRTEGFELLAEHHSQMANEVVRYATRDKPNSIVREAMLMLRPLLNVVRRVQRGPTGYREYCFSAYTCLCRK